MRGASDRPAGLLPTALSAWLSRIVLLPLAVLQGVALARGLGTEGLGRYSASLVDVNLLVALLSVGLPGGLAVLASRLQRKPAALRILSHIAWRQGLRIGVVLGLVGVALALGLRIPSRPVLLCVLIALLVLSQFARDMQNSLLWGGQRFALQNRLNIAVQVVTCLILLVLFWRGRLTVLSGLSVQLVSLVVWLLAARWLSAGQPLAMGFPDEEPGPDPAQIATAVHQIGLRSYTGLLLELFLMRVDLYLIEQLVPAGQAAHQLGLYQAGVRVAELLLMVPSTLNTILFAKAAARENVVLSTLCSAKLSAWLGLLGLLGMALCGQPLLVLLFGARFEGSFVPCLWVLLGCVSLCFSGPLAGALSGDAGYPRAILAAQLAAVVVNLGANLYWLPRHGIIGAAMASTLAYSVSALWIAVAFARRYGLALYDVLRPELPHVLWQTIRRTPV